MTSQVGSVSGTLNAAGIMKNAQGQNLVAQMASALPTLWVDAGLTSTTINVEARPAGSAGGFQPITPVGAATPNITAPGTYCFPPMGGDWEYAISATSYTSGSAAVYLGLSPNS